MPKGYWVTIYRKISDPKKLAAYAELAPKATAPFGGRDLARGTSANAYEAGLKDRIVISEFPSAEQARACYESPGYQNALKALGDGAERDVGLVRGGGERGPAIASQRVRLLAGPMTGSAKQSRVTGVRPCGGDC